MKAIQAKSFAQLLDHLNLCHWNYRQIIREGGKEINFLHIQKKSIDAI